MKILMIGSVALEHGGRGASGIGVHVSGLTLALGRLGIDVTVAAYGLAERSSYSSLAPFPIVPLEFASMRTALRSAATNPINAGMTMVRRSSGGVRLNLRQRFAVSLLSTGIARRIDETKPGVLHHHGTGLTLIAANEVGRRRDIPVVTTVHSLSGHTAPDHFEQVVVPSLFLPDQLITVSDGLEIEAQELGVAKERLTTIPNGVDLDRFQPVPRPEARARLEIAPGVDVVLFVGHLIARKGVDVLIEAFSTLAESNPNAILRILGGTGASPESDFLEKVYRMPGVLGIDEYVRFVGVISHDRLADWYSAADFLVLPSRAEGMGLVLIESMACGSPVIGSAVGGIPTVVQHEENGLLVPPSDADALASAMQRMLHDDDLRDRLGRVGSMTVKEKYTWESAASQVEAIYRSAISG